MQNFTVILTTLDQPWLAVSVKQKQECEFSSTLFTGSAAHNYCFVPKAEMATRDEHFECVQDTEAPATAQLKTLKKENIQSCVRNWQE